MTLFNAPQHPYTKRLVAASPTASSRIADLVPEEERGRQIAMPVAPRPQPAPGTPPLLEVQKLAKRFDQGAAAVADFSMTISAGESVGLVGESGSGKSTTSRIICRLIDPSEGEIAFEGQSIGHIPARDFHRSPFRKDIQIVFQDPNDSLNPRFTAFDCIAHPLLRLGGMRAGDALAAAGGGVRAARRTGDRIADALPASALGRPEGPRRHRPRHRLPAAPVGAGRADGGARRLGAGGGAATARPVAARG